VEFFDQLERIISISDPQKKIAHFSRFYADFQNGHFEIDHSKKSREWERPSYAEHCRVVAPGEVPRRGLGTKEGRAALLHAIAHIEYSAIDLALDAAYRFKNMPAEFYADWLEVADDECRHFLMIGELLLGLGYRYGDFAVHAGLFEAARRTPTLLERMAVVPRYLEANGLDANPKLIAKLKKMGDESAQKIAEALEVILREEIDHVRKGDRWYRWACEREGVADPAALYREIIERHYPGSLRTRQDINIEARKAAGFTCDEMRMLAGKEIGC
jgi:uncharacterized ferritin-like protein (DUF455 family)